MRYTAAVTSLSWIPSEAITSLATRIPFDAGIAHYDVPPPDVIEDLESLREADRFRFANHLEAWIEVEDGRVVGHRQSGRGHIGSTTLKVGRRQATFEAVALPDLRPQPAVSATAVTFLQTCGGRTGVPAPRRVWRAPFLQLSAPLAWTTLSLTIRADGTHTHELVGASPFPRHWIYGADGKLAAKSGIIDFSSWYRRAFGRHSPWGDRDSPALCTEIESALERRLSEQFMRGGAKPAVRRIKAGEAVVRQGAQGQDLFLLLDGVVRVEVDGKRVAEYGPGSVHGERALLQGGARTSTVVAVTDCRVALARADQLNRDALVELSAGHRREQRA